MQPVNAALGWALAAAAVALGYAGYGWPGVLLALTVVVFWLLLQFSQALRVMRNAAQRPIGSIGSIGGGARSALMLQSKLQRGMRLPQVMKLTGSFGVAVPPSSAAPPDSEAFAWTDAGGDTLHMTLTAGRVAAWELQRAGAPSGTPPETPSETPSADGGA